ncbi:LADA_0B02938g1_1 [Lachancea dasiensis]|uniref:LADA_0B02938g1_1 n=1 Tax=Lachancea dasiensis TaxID=1072105 RepID=A0A1G4IS94_9SACH|nr:LADA_0B02938g1_1 [Lachancea dasiensis]
MSQCYGSFEYIKEALEPLTSEQLIADEDPVLGEILSTKVLANIDTLRNSVVQGELGTQRGPNGNEEQLGRFRKHFSELECTALMVQSVSTNKLKEQYEHHVRDLRSKRLSVDFDANTSPESLEDSVENLSAAGGIEDQDESLGELRLRLLGKKNERSSTSLGTSEHTMENQMQVHDNIQTELIDDMSQLISGLKVGAEAFQAALEEDSTVLKATELGLQATSRSLTNLGGKLKKYHNSKVGLLFYLGCILFIFLSLATTYLIIKIFPKM